MSTSIRVPVKVVPPERGSFPLDLGNECGEFVKKYLICVKSNKGDNPQCRELAKEYLECRMNKGLMDKDEMRNLGFHNSDKK